MTMIVDGNAAMGSSIVCTVNTMETLRDGVAGRKRDGVIAAYLQAKPKSMGVRPTLIRDARIIIIAMRLGELSFGVPSLRSTVASLFARYRLLKGVWFSASQSPL